MKKLLFFIPLLLVFFLASCATTPKSDDTGTMDEMGETMVYEGYLIDVYCGASGTGMDGSDVVNSPWDHTTKCLVMCEEGGYGLTVMDGDTYKFIHFADGQSNEKAMALIAGTERLKDNKVAVEGFMVDGKLCVVSIVEISEFSM